MRIPPQARFGRSVRKKVLLFADRFEVRREEIEEFIFAVGEALANAIEHSSTGDAIEVHCRIEKDRILATIIDSGSGFQSEHASDAKLPDALAERGRGLPLMRRCSDIFAIHSVPGRGTAVVLGTYLRRRRENQETAAVS